MVTYWKYIKSKDTFKEQKGVPSSAPTYIKSKVSSKTYVGVKVEAYKLTLVYNGFALATLEVETRCGYDRGPGLQKALKKLYSTLQVEERR